MTKNLSIKLYVAAGSLLTGALVADTMNRTYESALSLACKASIER